MTQSFTIGCGHRLFQLVGQTSRQLPATGSAMRVLEVPRDGAVYTMAPGTPRASAATLARELAAKSDQLAVGDWVLAAGDDSGGLWVAARMVPLNQLVRRTSEGRASAW